MRLFLASQDFGKHGERLSAMVGENRRALVVFNARDAKSDIGLEKQKTLCAQYNLQFQRLELRDYFGKSEELREFVDNYEPGVIVLLGGNTFLLRRALFQSGLDEILRHDIATDRYVFAGHSAGAIVAGPSLEGFEKMDEPDRVLPGYQEEIVWDGLGLTDVRIIPHADSSKYSAAATQRQADFSKNGWRHIVLNDSDVFVIDGTKEEILR